MPTILKTKSLYYSDVNLISDGGGQVNSRSEIPKELSRIIISPMSAIIGEKFIIAAAKQGIGIALHRFCEPKEQVRLFNLFLKSGGDVNNIFVAIGLNEGPEYLKSMLKRFKKFPVNLLIDVAIADIPKLNSVIQQIDKIFHYKRLMIGNCHSEEGLKSLLSKLNITNSSKLDIKEDVEYFIRVGIGGGSPCFSSDSCGVNRGQITEIIECSNFVNTQGLDNVFIVADGGIYKPGNAVKAFGAGASYCLMGGYFVKAKEAQTHVIGDGEYWGGASDKQQILHKGKKYRHSEGKCFKVKEKLVSLESLVNELWGGIASGVSYAGYKTLTDFIDNGVFEVKQNSLPPKNRN